MRLQKSTNLSLHLQLASVKCLTFFLLKFRPLQIAGINFFFLSLLISVTIFTSSINTAEPASFIKSGRRDYIWTVDTLSYPGSNQTLMNAIWGQNPNNLWVVGHNERGFGKMYHFNGSEWSPVDLINVQSPNFYSIIGFDQNNIFVIGSANYLINNQVSDSSLILKYNGSNWEISLFNKGRSLFSISGSNNDLYTVGRYKSYFQFDGVNWVKKDLDIYIPTGYDNHFASSILIGGQSNLMFYQCTKEEKTIYYFLVYENNQWIKVDSFCNTSLNNYKWGSKLWKSPDGDVYSVSPGLYKLNGTQWESILNDYYLYTAINGTSKNNIFLAGQRVIHFNGKDWYEFSDISFKYGIATTILCFDKEVYFVFVNEGKSFIVKGELIN